jgi:hypothetical protein
MNGSKVYERGLARFPAPTSTPRRIPLTAARTRWEAFYLGLTLLAPWKPLMYRILLSTTLPKKAEACTRFPWPE